MALQGWFFEDPVNPDARPELSTPEFWQALVPGAGIDADELTASLAAASAARAAASHVGALAARAAVENVGYFMTPASVRSTSLCVSLCAITTALRIAGLPPHFIFVFNAAWELLEEQMATVATDVLGQDVILEADMSCWALRRDNEADAYVGGIFIYLFILINGICLIYLCLLVSMTFVHLSTAHPGAFSNSHRDQRYSACHDEDGVPQSLNLWVPFNPSGARADNGAMRVLPVPVDEFFFSPHHPLHMDTATALASSGGKGEVVLECGSGATCAWSPSVVHWGGTCAADAVAEPRTSLAATFRAANAPRSEFGTSIGGAAGPAPMTRASLDVLPLRRRLAFVAKGLLAYSHWAPGFPGVNIHAI